MFSTPAFPKRLCLLKSAAVLLAHVFTQVLLPILVMFGCGWLLDRRARLDLGTLMKTWSTGPAPGKARAIRGMP